MLSSHDPKWPSSTLLLSGILFVGFLFFPQTVFTQSASSQHWQNLKQDDGLISGDVQTILVDGASLWFGTDSGISRFDGEWRSYHSLSDPDLIGSTMNRQSALPAGYLPRGTVRTMLKSPWDQSIWAIIWPGSESSYLIRWDAQTDLWHFVFQLPTHVHTLQAVDRELWLGTDAGLYLYDTTTPVVTAEARPTRDNFSASLSIYDLALDDDAVWMGTTAGLWYIDDGEWGQTPTPPRAAYLKANPKWCAERPNVDLAIPNPAQISGAPALNGLQDGGVKEDNAEEISALWIDGENALWIGTPYGVARQSAINGCWTTFPTEKPTGEPARVQRIYGDGNGSVWVVTDGGGARRFVDYGQITLEYGRSVAGNLTTNFVRDVVVDLDGTVWFATPIGLFRYFDRLWFSDPSDSVASMSVADPNFHDVRDLLIADDGVLWIATGAGIRVKEGLTFSDKHFSIENSGLPVDTVLALAQDSHGDIWAGTFGGGVARYHAGKWGIPFHANQLPSPIVVDLLIDKNTLWIGTELGLASYNLLTQSLTIERELLSVNIESIAIDSISRLWVGTRDANIWTRQPDGAWSSIDRAEIGSIMGMSQLPQNVELTLSPDPTTAGAMWAAIDRVGLLYWDGARWSNGDSDGHLPTNFLWTIFTDTKTGDLWVGNEGGVTRFDGRSWETLKDSDGLRSPAIYAIAGTAEGGYWLGGRLGLSYYRPDQTAPWLRVVSTTNSTDAEQNENAVEITPGERLRLKLSYGDLQTPKEKVRIYYRQAMLSNAGHWTELQTPFEIPFEESGTYRIEFQARDQSFNYSPVVKKMVAVIPAAPKFHIPGQGEVTLTTFLTMIALSIVAFAGLGYVSFEILRDRRSAIRAMTRGYNPYVSGEPIRKDDMFFARHDLLQRIVDTLHNNSIMIHGERRIGKTTLLYQLRNRLEDVDDADYWFLPIYIDLEGTPQEKFFHFLIDEISQSAVQLVGDNAVAMQELDKLLFYDVLDEEYTDREFSRDMRRIINTLQEYGGDQYPSKRLRVILLLDEMDVISRYDHLTQQQLRRIFMREFAANLGAIVAGIQISHEWDRIESPWYNLFNEIEIEPFTHEQAIELLVEPVRDVYSYNSDALDFIVEQSMGRPFRLQQYALESVTHMLAQKRRKVKLRDAQLAHQNIQNSGVQEYQHIGLSQSDKTTQPLPDAHKIYT